MSGVKNVKGAEAKNCRKHSAYIRHCEWYLRMVIGLIIDTESIKLFEKKTKWITIVPSGVVT